MSFEESRLHLYWMKPINESADSEPAPLAGAAPPVAILTPPEAKPSAPIRTVVVPLRAAALPPSPSTSPALSSGPSPTPSSGVSSPISGVTGVADINPQTRLRRIGNRVPRLMVKDLLGGDPVEVLYGFFPKGMIITVKDLSVAAGHHADDINKMMKVWHRTNRVDVGSAAQKRWIAALNVKVNTAVYVQTAIELGLIQIVG